MKKIITLALLLATLAAAASAQKPATKKAPAKTAAAPATEKTYTFTDKGVDLLVMGQKLRLQPPAGSFYDRAVKTHVNDFGTIYYDLKKKGKTIGWVAVSEGKVAGIHIKAKNVQLSNGIKVGDLLTDVLDKEGVSAGMMYNMMDEYTETFIHFNDVEIYPAAGDQLSASGEKKKEELEKKTAAWDPFESNSEQPNATLTKEDFVPGITVGELAIGIRY